MLDSKLVENCRTLQFKLAVTWAMIPLHKKCFSIAGLYMFTGLLNLATQLVVLAILTGGFQCTINAASIHQIEWWFLEGIMLVLNMGTHGFTPYPFILRPYYMAFHDEASTAASQCYHGMVHISHGDFLMLLFNIVWIGHVVGFSASVYTNNYAWIRYFSLVTLLRTVAQLVFLVIRYDESHFSNPYVAYMDNIGVIKVIDIVMSCFFIYIMTMYANEVKKLNVETIHLINPKRALGEIFIPPPLDKIEGVIKLENNQVILMTKHN